MMNQKDVTKTCYNLTAVEYAKTFFNELEGKPLDQLFLKRFASENFKKGMIADLGCGPGQTTAFLYQNGATELLGIDISEEMVQVAKEKTKGKIDFEAGDMTDLRFTNNYFGGIIAFYAIVHFEQEELDIPFQEIYRVLKEGGQFLLSFHVGSGIKSVDEFLGHTVSINFYFFEVDIVLQKLKNAGFRLIDAVVRYPYEEKEYPSKRAYILVEK